MFLTVGLKQYCMCTVHRYTFVTCDLKTQVSDSNDSSIIAVNFIVKKNRKIFLFYFIFGKVSYQKSGPGSSVGIAAELWAGRSGIESRWGRDFPPVQSGPWVHPASCKIGTGSFLGVKCGRSVLLTTHHFLVPRSWKSRAVTLPNLWATPGL